MFRDFDIRVVYVSLNWTRNKSLAEPVIKIFIRDAENGDQK